MPKHISQNLLNKIKVSGEKTETPVQSVEGLAQLETHRYESSERMLDLTNQLKANPPPGYVYPTMRDFLHFYANTRPSDLKEGPLLVNSDEFLITDAGVFGAPGDTVYGVMHGSDHIFNNSEWVKGDLILDNKEVEKIFDRSLIRYNRENIPDYVSRNIEYGVVIPQSDFASLDTGKMGWTPFVESPLIKARSGLSHDLRPFFDSIEDDFAYVFASIFTTTRPVGMPLSFNVKKGRIDQTQINPPYTGILIREDLVEARV